jgi:hypothetical protein
MTESVQETVVGDAQVDTTRKYALNAGKCEQCGQFKTWDFRVPNAKTGKQLPGHVTGDGYKIGNGDCPYWARIKSMNERKGVLRKSGATALDSELVRSTGKSGPAGGGSTIASAIQAIPATLPAPVLAVPPAPASPGIARQAEGSITVLIHGIPVVMSVTEALGMCKQVAEELLRLHTSSR